MRARSLRPPIARRLARCALLLNLTLAGTVAHAGTEAAASGSHTFQPGGPREGERNVRYFT